MDHTDDLPARIAALEARIEELRRAMEAACGEFLEATKPAVAAWFERRVEAEVMARPEVLKTLSRDTLRSLKADLRLLVAQTPELVDEHVNRDAYWAHRRRVLDDSGIMLNLFLNPYEARGRRSPQLLDRAIRDVLEVCEGLLARYGFGESELGQVPLGRVPFEWTDAMSAAIERYALLFGDLKRINVDLLPALRRVADAQARRLWDEA